MPAMRARWLIGLVVWCSCTDEPLPLPALRAGTPCPQVVVREVNDHWIDTHPFWGGTNWERTTYFIGNLAAADAFGVPAYLDYTLGWADYWEYELNRAGLTDTRNAELQAAGQVYLDLYERNPDPALIADIASSLDYVIRYSDGTDWSWAEAQFFASPSFAHLGAIAMNARYTDTMFALFTDARDRRGLFDPATGLWFTDGDTDHDAITARGNGMVMAAVARTLSYLTPDSPYRPAYEDMLRTMAAAVAPLQRGDGMWNAALIDPDGPIGPEASGTAFITYALAWGIVHDVLDRAVYLPIVEQAWRGLVATAVRADLEIGYVQEPRDEPNEDDPLTLRDTADYGVGVFLLAGSEVVKLGLALDCP